MRLKNVKHILEYNAQWCHPMMLTLTTCHSYGLNYGLDLPLLGHPTFVRVVVSDERHMWHNCGVAVFVKLLTLLPSAFHRRRAWWGAFPGRLAISSWPNSCCKCYHPNHRSRTPSSDSNGRCPCSTCRSSLDNCPVVACYRTRVFQPLKYLCGKILLRIDFMRVHARRQKHSWFCMWAHIKRPKA